MAEEVSLQLLDEFITVASELNATDKPCRKPKLITAKNEDSHFLEKISKFDKGIKDISDPIPNSSTQSVVHTGETDSSDDEDLKDLEHRKYHEAGRDIRRLLASSSTSTDLVLNPSWRTNTIKQPKNNNIVPPKSKLNPIEATVYSDPIFRLRLVNPLISSVTLQDRMRGRTAVSMSRIKRHVATLNPNEDWVIAGAIISKVVKKSQKGNQFSIWIISDLHDDLKTVAIFLFSGAHKNLWKTAQGTVLGVLNPTVMEQKEKSSHEATLSVNNSDRIMILGQSKDLGICRSRKKSGDPCTAFVNKNRCEYCIYHVKMAYQKFSTRSDLQSSFVGGGLDALRNKVLGKSEVFYAGKSFTAVKAPSKRSSQKLRSKDEGILEALASDVRVNTNCNVRAKNLNKGAANKIDSSVSERKKDIELLQKLHASPNTIEVGKRISRIPPIDQLKTTKATAQYDRTFDLFTGRLETKKNFDGALSNSVTLSDSKNTALDVIAKLKAKKVANKQTNEQLLSDKKDMTINLAIQDVTNDEDDLNYDSDDLNNDKLESIEHKITTSTLKRNKNVSNIFETTNTNITKRDCAKSTNLQSDLSSRAISQLHQSTAVPKVNSKDSQKSNLAFDIPLLSGFSGKSVDLNAPISRTHMNRAKQNAIIYVQRNGPIAKVDPMAVKSAKRKIPVHPDIISPSAKKLKEIQENEFMSQRFKRLMAASSRHSELLEKIDNDEQDKYFNKMEIKEKMEEKMLETFKVNCKAVKCLKCKYTNFSASDRCKAEKHPLRVFDTVKRFFKCCHCGNRTVSLTVVPLENCQKCLDGKWERCAMIAERNVKSLTQLSIRGGEEHYVGGAVSNANINLMVPEDGT